MSTIVYQPSEYWREVTGCLSYEVFETLRGGKNMYPEVPHDQWIELDIDCIGNPTVITDTDAGLGDTRYINDARIERVRERARHLHGLWYHTFSSVDRGISNKAVSLGIAEYHYPDKNPNVPGARRVFRLL